MKEIVEPLALITVSRTRHPSSKFLACGEDAR